MAVPTVTGLDPASGPEGTEVLIVGTGFTEDTSRVRFGTYECQLNYTVISDTAIMAIAPAGTGTVYVLVTNPDGSNSTGAQFTFSTYVGGSNAVPTVTGLSDHTAPGYDGEGGETITISGTGFESAIAVYFGTSTTTRTQVDFTKVSPTSLTCVTPRGEPGTTSYVWVENSYGVSVDADSDNAYAYQSSAVPTVTGLTPATALPGMTVTVAGTNFTTATQVRVGTLTAEFIIVGDTSITFTVPGDTSFLGTTAEVYVSNFWGESTTHQTLTYATAGTLRTTLSLSGGYTPAMSPRDNWIVTGSSVTCTLTATYTPWSGETYVESKWYRRDNDAPARYTGTFTVSGEGSHKIEFWSVGKDGIIETANVRYVNIVATATPTLTATAGISQIAFSWTSIKIPGCYYVLYYGTGNPPSTNPTTLDGCAFTYIVSPGTNIYARVRVYGPDGTDYGYSNVTGPTQSNSIQASDLANDSISNAKLAPSLKPPPLLASAPGLPSSTYPAGSYYYNTTNSTLYITNDGTTWSSASPQALAVIGQVIAGAIRAGAISATEIAADSIYAKHLIIADYENLVPNASSELALPSGLSYPVAYDSAEIEFRGVINTNANRGNNCRRVTGNTAAVYLALCDPVPAKAGDVFRIQVKSKVGTTGTAQVAIAGVNASGNDVATPTASTGTTSTSYQSDGPPILYDSVQYTVPSGSGASAAVAVRAYLMYTGSAGTYGYFDDILFRKMVAGELVVDGAITAAKIEANTITGDQIHANVALSAPVITGGTITGTSVNVESNLLVGTATSSGTITLAGPAGTPGLFRSKSSGPRIEIYSTDPGYIDFQTDNSNELDRARFYIYDGTTYLRNQWVGPRWQNTGVDPSAPYIEQYVSESLQKITLKTNHTDNTTAQIELSGQDKHVAIAANGTTLEVGESADTAKLTGDLFITRGIIPNYAGAIYRETDCMGPTTALAASTGAEWGGDAFGTGGTITSETGSSTHPGIAGLHTGTASGGGVSLRTAIDALTLAVGDWAEFIVDFNYCGTATQCRLGFMDQFGNANPTSGAWFNLANTTLTAKAYFTTGGIATSASYTVTQGSWYRLRVYVYSTTHVYFYIYANGSATPETSWGPMDLSSGSYTLGTGTLGHGASTFTTSTVQQDTLYLDYMSMYLVPRSR